jgi:hypothetical protein
VFKCLSEEEDKKIGSGDISSILSFFLKPAAGRNIFCLLIGIDGLTIPTEDGQMNKRISFWFMLIVFLILSGC